MFLYHLHLSLQPCRLGFIITGRENYPPPPSHFMHKDEQGNNKCRLTAAAAEQGRKICLDVSALQLEPGTLW